MAVKKLSMAQVPPFSQSWVMGTLSQFNIPWGPKFRMRCQWVFEHAERHMVCLAGEVPLQPKCVT